MIDDLRSGGAQIGDIQSGSYFPRR
jgi:hypothetical protein